MFTACSLLVINNMQTYLINLDKDKERLAVADVQLKRLNVFYERFPAVYAKELPKGKINTKVNYFRWWCCLGRNILPGEIGCALSHYTLYQKMVDEKIQYSCILEDDVVLKENFKSTVERVEKWIDTEKSQVILLSNHTSEPENGEEIRGGAGGLCSDSYIITLPAAKALLKENLPICVPCDHWGRWVRHGTIKLYLSVSSVCTQNWKDFESNMTNSIQKVSDMSFLSRMLHYVKRLIGKSIDEILFLLRK